WIESDAKNLLSGKRRVLPPTAMRNRIYAKDVPFSNIKKQAHGSMLGFFQTQDVLLASILDREGVSKLLCGSRNSFDAHRSRLRKRFQEVGQSREIKQFHSLYLNQAPLHRQSLVNLAGVDFEGVSSVYLYLKTN